MVNNIHHNENVKQFFDSPSLYLKNEYGIRIRLEIIQDLVENYALKSILDVGCGDGSISIPLLPYTEKLTLLDISPEMLSIVKSKIGKDIGLNIKLIEGDLQLLDNINERFDLVLAIGVLAHVQSTKHFLQIMNNIILPTGHLILQFSNSLNIINIINRLTRKTLYKINHTSKNDVITEAEKLGFKVVDIVQFGLMLPGMGYLPNDFLYSYQKLTSTNKLMSKLGTDYIVMLQK